jgi:hypothetical protein
MQRQSSNKRTIQAAKRLRLTCAQKEQAMNVPHITILCRAVFPLED